MSAFASFVSAVPEDVAALRGKWGWFVVLGLALLILGSLAIMYPVLATWIAIEVIGYCLVLAAAFEVASVVWARSWRGFVMHLFCGLLYLFLGVILIEHTEAAATAYTLVLSFFLVGGGTARVVLALVNQFSGWGWALIAGVVSILLGIMIWRHLLEMSEIVIGIFVGVDLVFNGWSWFMLGLALRPEPANRM